MKQSNLISRGIYGLFTLVVLTLFACQETELQETTTIDEAVELQEEVDGTIIPNHYIVQFKDDFLPASSTRSQGITDREVKKTFSEAKRVEGTQKIESFLQRTSIDRETVDHIYTAALSGFSAKLTAEQVEELEADPKIKFVEPDRYVKLDDMKVEKSDEGNARAQTTPCGITNAGGAASGASSGKWIWIADTGIDLDHPDLNVNSNSTYAKSFVGDNDPNDYQGHGTHVSGTAAAVNNSIGVIGVSAGASVVPVKVLSNSGSGSYAGIAAGLNHIATYDIPGDAVNLSLGGSGCIDSGVSTALTNLGNAGTLVAIAAGNSGVHAGTTQPACLNGTNLYTITSMYCNKTWGFRNYGNPPVDYIATGRSVYSTYLNGGYATLSGTSMATPHVAGILHQRGGAPATSGSVCDPYGYCYPIAVR